MNYSPNNQEQTSIGLQWNAAALLAYAPIVGIIFLFIEKKFAYVKFHAAQSTIMHIAYIISNALLIIPVLGWIASPIISLLLFIFHIIAAVNAWKGMWYKIPVLGDLAQKLADAVK